jgi:hypothetical protein
LGIAYRLLSIRSCEKDFCNLHPEVLFTLLNEHGDMTT